MKAHLIHTLDEQALLPERRHGTNDHIVGPAMSPCPRVVSRASATVDHQAPEIFCVEVTAYERQRIQRGECITIHIDRDDGGPESRSVVRQLVRPRLRLTFEGGGVES